MSIQTKRVILKDNSLLGICIKLFEVNCVLHHHTLTSLYIISNCCVAFQGVFVAFSYVVVAFTHLFL